MSIPGIELQSTEESMLFSNHSGQRARFVSGARLRRLFSVELLEARVLLSTTFDVKLEAENAKLSGPLIQTNHTGYSGSGFINFQANGNYAQWTVNTPSAGSYLLDFRYANGGTTNRPMSISTNGTVVNASQAFNPTANWDTWSDSTLNVALLAGNNTVDATEVGASAPNLDYLEVTGQEQVAAPAAPSNLKATATGTTSASEIHLSWIDNAGDETGFTVNQATNSTFTSGLVSSNVTANEASFTATDLSAATTYYFQVEATNAGGSSVYSNTANATTSVNAVSAFPDATNTGPTNPSILVPSGSITVTTNGAIIQNVAVTGGINIEANNVTIRNFVIYPSGVDAIRIYPGFSNALVEDGEIAGSGTTDTDGIDFANYTALRLNVHNLTDGFKANGNATIEDCYIHDLNAILVNGSYTHNDGIQDDGGNNIVVEHNNIQRAGVGNSCLQIKCDLGGIDNFLIENNLLNGGNYSIYVNTGADGTPTNVTIADNLFGRNYIYGLSSLQGSVVWTNNEWDDTNLPAPTGGNPATELTVTAPYNFAANKGSGIQTVTENWIDITSTGSATLDSAANHSNRTLLATSGLAFDGSAGVWQGELDLTNNDLIVHGGNLANIQSQLQAGFNSPAGYWNGSAGIVSTSAANDTRYLTTLGYRTGGSPFDGLNTSSTDVLVKYTYYGDANLDGVVNGADYQQIDNGFGEHLTGWQNGDFNYDGVIDGSDFSLIDNAFNQLSATGASPLATLAGKVEGIAQTATKSAGKSSAASALGLNQVGNAGILADGTGAENLNVEDLINNSSGSDLLKGRGKNTRYVAAVN
jgi:hypothetical protein